MGLQWVVGIHRAVEEAIYHRGQPQCMEWTSRTSGKSSIAAHLMMLFKLDHSLYLIFLSLKLRIAERIMCCERVPNADYLWNSNLGRMSIKESQISNEILSRTNFVLLPKQPPKILTKLKMFARSFSALVLALPVLAAASVVTRTDSDQCNTGSFQCCQSTQPVSDISLQPPFNEFRRSFYQRPARRRLPGLLAFLGLFLMVLQASLVVRLSHDCDRLRDWQNRFFSDLFPHCWWKLLH